MLFNSIPFAIFLPVVFAIHWLLPHKYRWVLLLAASYYFYMSWNARYLVLILFTTAVSYAAGILLEREASGSRKRWILGTGTVLCLGVLVVFKYFNFLSESAAFVLSKFSIPLHPVTLQLILPVGISFYTFQTLGYVIDVYRGDSPAEHHFGYYATFISFFPQLVAGPIERTSNLLPQIRKERSFDYEQAMYGARLILWGLFKKMAVADVVAPYVDLVYEAPTAYQGFDLLAVVLFFSIQIYCDFSGYSDIAIGSAKLLGIDLMTNFRSPYFSDSIRGFWDRWHISLSTWFRDYVYIPLGGNRCGRLRQRCNLLITFLVSGMWHGANWTFAAWGLIHGTARLAEDVAGSFLSRIRGNRIGKVLMTMLVFVFCNLAWVFFRAETFGDARYVLTHLFTGIQQPATFFRDHIGLDKVRFLQILGLIGIVAIYDGVSLRTDLLRPAGRIFRVTRAVIGYALIGIIYWCLLHYAGKNQFVYFQF